MIKIIRVVNSVLEENCYIIHNDKFALIIDPGSDSNKIIKEIEKNNLNILGILITHYHFDHITSLEIIKDKYKIKNIYDYTSNDNINIDTFNFNIIHNPGHTKDSVSFYFKDDNIMFTGDFIFKETIGNFEDDMQEEMIKSLKTFKKIKNNVIIYPGHGEDTTLEHEIKYNYFLRGI